MIRPIEWDNERVKVLDQTSLPQDIVWFECSFPSEIAEAIENMQIRGAPLIGVAAAFGVALAAIQYKSKGYDEFIKAIKNVVNRLQKTRPTAVNLAWALNRMLNLANKNNNVKECCDLLVKEAQEIMREDEAMCRKIGEAGKVLLKGDGVIKVITHCNAGALATAGWGTALGVIRSAHECGTLLHVYMDETRPALQGARLTAWELSQDKIPCTLITDNMAGFLMQKEKIHAVIVGADRITANGDFANKIGTYMLAVMAKTHQIPFYVAAPYSSVDLTLFGGDKIPIEERSSKEVTHIQNCLVAPIGINVWNPAFDVTPYEYVTAFITERGIISPPFKENIAAFFNDQLTV